MAVSPRRPRAAGAVRGIVRRSPPPAAALLALGLVLGTATPALPFAAQAQPPRPPAYLLKPDRVFDGVTASPHAGWVVLVRGERIEAAGPAAQVRAPADARVIDLPGTTLLP